MDNTKAGSEVIKRSVQLLLVVLGILGLYYLYQYFFVSTRPTYSTLLSGSQSSSTSPASPIIIPASSMIPMYEGGTFTISTWVYLNNWNYRIGMNKHILSIGGNTFDTLRVYLSPFSTQLNVRLQTKELNSVPSNTTPSIPSDNLLNSTAPTFFSTVQTNSELTDSFAICDLPAIDMQRWVNITVSVDGRTCDIYMDGKLARSCVLPSFYKVDTGYSAKLLNYGGFGGYIGNTTLYGTALNPAEIYSIYNSGPTPLSFFGNLSSILKPSSM